MSTQQPTHKTITNIPYTLTNTHPRQMLDIHLPILPPSNTSSPIPTPLILYIHGGAFKFGSKESPLLPIRQVQVNKYIVAALNYRLSGDAPFPAMIQDCKSAVRYLKSQDFAEKYGVSVDPERVVVWGESAGGHAAAFLGTTSQSMPVPGGSSQSMYDVGDYLDVPGSSSVAGVVDYYGPTDFLAMDSHLPEGFQTHGDADSPESLYLGRKISEIPEVCAQANPCTYVEDLVKRESGGRVPAFFIAHGTADRIVPEYMSLVLRDELVKFGVDVQYLPVEGTDHVFRGITEEQQGELDRLTDEFLRKVFAV